MFSQDVIAEVGARGYKELRVGYDRDVSATVFIICEDKPPRRKREDSNDDMSNEIQNTSRGASLWQLPAKVGQMEWAFSQFVVFCWPLLVGVFW